MKPFIQMAGISISQVWDTLFSYVRPCYELQMYHSDCTQNLQMKQISFKIALPIYF